MTLTIPDDVLTQTGLTEREVLIELACRLYDAEKLSKPAAVQLSGLERADFEDELVKRGLPWIRVSGDNYLEPEMNDFGSEQCAFVQGPVCKHRGTTY